MTDPRDALEESIRGRVCSVCGQQPRVAVVRTEYQLPPSIANMGQLPFPVFGLRCACGAYAGDMANLARPERYETKRLREMEEMAARLERERPEPPSVEESGLW